ncbi:MAG: cupin domain-containing protein [Flavobacteriaceae bacterium]
MKYSHFIYIIGFIILLFSCKAKQTLPDPLKAGWNGESVCQLIKENKALRVLKCTFPPGVGHERHFHKPHFGYTLAGSKFKMKDTTGVKEVQVLTGTNFYSNGTEWHEVLNIGDSTAVFLIMEPKQ